MNAITSHYEISRQKRNGEKIKQKSNCTIEYWIPVYAHLMQAPEISIALKSKFPNIQR